MAVPDGAGPGAERRGRPCRRMPCAGAPTGVLAWLQAWLADDRFGQSRLVVVTRGAVRRPPTARHRPGAAPPCGAWCARRSPSTRAGSCWSTSTTAPRTRSGSARRVCGAGEPQVAVRGGAVLAASTGPGCRRRHWPPPAGRRRGGWTSTERGTLDNLALVPAPEAAAPLAAGQVRVAVRAAGLNFRDVLDRAGHVPGATRPLGSEGAGVVIEVGPGVTGPGARRPGDRPVRRRRSARSRSTDQRLLARMPDGWSFAQAASVPVVFLTAYYGLVDLAGAAAGRVGAGARGRRRRRHGGGAAGPALGAEVFATASPGKWDALRGLGSTTTTSRRRGTSTSSERFLAATGGRGVDVVLNSLAGEFVDASLRLLPPGGRFLEMGKTDIRDPAEVADGRPGSLPGVRPGARPARTGSGEMLAELLDLFDRGVLQPLPVTAWDVRRARRGVPVHRARPGTSARSCSPCRARWTRTARC